MNVDPVKQAEMDQAIKAQADVWPETWWSMYEACVEKGFTPNQAIDLIREYTNALIWSAVG